MRVVRLKDATAPLLPFAPLPTSTITMQDALMSLVSEVVRFVGLRSFRGLATRLAGWLRWCELVRAGGSLVVSGIGGGESERYGVGRGQGRVVFLSSSPLRRVGTMVGWVGLGGRMGDR